MENNNKIILGYIQNFQQIDNRIIITLDNAVVEFIILSNRILREKIYFDNTFYDATHNKILVINGEVAISNYYLHVEEDELKYVVETENLRLIIIKDPFKLEAYSISDNLYFKETHSIYFESGKSIQVLDGDEKEHFYGCGVQNGHFAHRGREVSISLQNFHWNAGSVSNPSPFYVSTKGYGQFRNTFCPAIYNFSSNTVLSQNEKQLDIFYLFGDSLQNVINLFTQITGRPHLIPRWGFSPGDASCCKETLDAIEVVNGYVNNKIPRGWILPNDGYGCGYTDLKALIQHAQGYHVRVGLWAEEAMPEIKKEVAEYGVRVIKVDSAWVDRGYEYALDAVESCHKGIENNCNERAYVWSCCGWAGTQRYATVWTGD